MDKVLFHLILYVKSQESSRDFYSQILQKAPSLDVLGMTEFRLSEELKLGIMPEKGIAKILGNKLPSPQSGSGIPRCELYIFTDNIEEDFARALKAGAKSISEIEDRDWGDRVGYLADLDGNILAFAQRISKVNKL